MSPFAAPTRCSEPRCRAYVTRHGRCDDHQRPAWANPSANTRTLSAADRARFRRAVLDRDPTCTWPGCTAPSEQADHIVPVGDGGALHDLSNGRGLCIPHHDAVTRQQNADRNRRRAAARRAAKDANR